MRDAILDRLPPSHPWRENIIWLEETDSTNTFAKQLARNGAKAGTVVLAGAQSAGRGRLGRSFSSPAGQGIYFSCVLRPGCRPEELMHLTCAAAIAAGKAVATVTGFFPGIKWANDLVAGTQKLGGILTEIQIEPVERTVEYAVIGVGINCFQLPEDFPPEIRSIACSLLQVTGQKICLADLYSELILEFSCLSDGILSEKSGIMELYREKCVTLGKEISICRGDDLQHGLALSVAEDGSLLVRKSDGTTVSVSSGEVSIRGMYGYL